MNDKKVILICANYRGLTQPIRILLCYLDIQYEQYHMSHEKKIEQQQFILPNNIQIDIEKMPYLLHEKLVIHENFAILNYICKRFQQQHMLGSNIYQQTLVQQVMQKFEKKKSKKFFFLINFLNQLTDNPLKKTQVLKKYFDCLTNKICDFIQPCVKMYEQNGKKTILSKFSVLDILVYDFCFYAQGFFCEIQDECPLVKECIEVKKNFQLTQFFRKNEQNLEKHKLFCHDPTKKCLQPMKKYWNGNKNAL